MRRFDPRTAREHLSRWDRAGIGCGVFLFVIFCLWIYAMVVWWLGRGVP